MRLFLLSELWKMIQSIPNLEKKFSLNCRSLLFNCRRFVLKLENIWRNVSWIFLVEYCKLGHGTIILGSYYGMRLLHIFEIPNISNEKPSISIEIPSISIENLEFQSKNQVVFHTLNWNTRYFKRNT